MSIIPKQLTTTKPHIRNLLLLFALLSVSLLLYDLRLPTTASFAAVQPPPPLNHILFSVASSASSLPSRAPYLRLWRRPVSHLNTTFLFLDRPPSQPSPPSLPPIIVQTNTSSFSSAHRIAHIVQDAVALDVPGIHWYVFGDDDTFFFTENLVRILSKYDHDKWYYIGSSSESYEQNEKFYFDMAYGGGGFAVSAPLARVLARVIGSCIDRYRHLFGSDARIFACLAELGVRLTVETGFHQVDVRGDLFGMLSAHPLSLVASLHHIDSVEPIFPGMSRINSLQHLIKASRVDPARLLQQTVCYDKTNSLTVSISWGYAVQVYEGNQLLPDLLSVQRTFKPWKRGKNAASSRYMFKTRDYTSDLCQRPLVLFLDTAVTDDANGVWTNYTRYNGGDCSRRKGVERLKVVSVYSVNLDDDFEEVLLMLFASNIHFWSDRIRYLVILVRKRIFHAVLIPPLRFSLKSVAVLIPQDKAWDQKLPLNLMNFVTEGPKLREKILTGSKWSVLGPKIVRSREIKSEFYSALCQDFFDMLFFRDDYFSVYARWWHHHAVVVVIFRRLLVKL